MRVFLWNSLTGAFSMIIICRLTSTKSDFYGDFLEGKLHLEKQFSNLVWGFCKGSCLKNCLKPADSPVCWNELDLPHLNNIKPLKLRLFPLPTPTPPCLTDSLWLFNHFTSLSASGIILRFPAGLIPCTLMGAVKWEKKKKATNQQMSMLPEGWKG